MDTADAIEKQKMSHKEERNRAKVWTAKAREAAAEIAERDGALQGGPGDCSRRWSGKKERAGRDGRDAACCGGVMGGVAAVGCRRRLLRQVQPPH